MSDRNVTPITFLPLEQIALAFAARRTGPNRYRARCPSCGGRSFKVSICAGNDGRSTLLYCFGGCTRPQPRVPRKIDEHIGDNTRIETICF